MYTNLLNWSKIKKAEAPRLCLLMQAWYLWWCEDKRWIHVQMSGDKAGKQMMSKAESLKELTTIEKGLSYKFWEGKD